MVHCKKRCDEPDPKIATHGLQEERHSTMVANGGIAANSLHLLPLVQALDVPFLILTGDWAVYYTYAFIRKNEYYMCRNLIQVYYGTSLGGMQRYTNNRSRNRCRKGLRLGIEIVL